MAVQFLCVINRNIFSVSFRRIYWSWTKWINMYRCQLFFSTISLYLNYTMIECLNFKSGLRQECPDTSIPVMIKINATLYTLTLSLPLCNSHGWLGIKNQLPTDLSLTPHPPHTSSLLISLTHPRTLSFRHDQKKNHFTHTLSFTRL